MALECGYRRAYRDDLCCAAFWCPAGTDLPVAACRGCLLRGIYGYNPIPGANGGRCEPRHLFHRIVSGGECGHGPFGWGRQLRKYRQPES